MTPRALRQLYDTLEFLASLREPNDLKIWGRILEKAAVALEAEGAVYRYYDTMGRTLVPFHILGTDTPASEVQSSAVGEGICGWVAQFKEALLAPDAPAEKKFRSDIDAVPGSATRTVLALPLHINLDFVGVLEFFNKSGGGFDEADLELAQTIVRETSHAIRRLRLEDMVNRVTAYNASILDNLSGGFFAIDLQGRVMLCNPAARRILGVQGEVTDLPVEKVLAHIPELATLMRETISSKKTLKRQDLQWQYDGRTRILGYSTLLIQDTKGELTGAGVTFQDITSFKK
ncbi:MAG: GAF domain-containing protein [Elusimicrobiota bacterium]